MAADRIIFIRHAEKPFSGASGVDATGTPDPDSLVPQGWQRAGALVRFFDPVIVAAGEPALTPDVIFAAGVGEGSRSKRSLETVTPLAKALAARNVPFVSTYLKDDHAGLAADVATRDGVLLIAWEHKQIPAIAALVAPGAGTPSIWPDRFDLMWICERTGGAWSFKEKRQALLAGDEPEPQS